jgi:glycosyltransferase involved in cell wall biosynthesis
VLELYKDEPRVRYVVHERNRGGGAARNTGIAEARGYYVAFLDDDDVWYPWKLMLQVACFDEAPPQVALVYGGFRRVSADGTTIIERPDPTAQTLPNLLKRNGIGTTSLVMCRRTSLVEIEGFDERLPSMQDLDLYVRLAQRFPFAMVGELLLDKHQHAGEAIGKNFDGIVQANRLYYEKHRALFERHRDIHHHRLRSYGHEVLRAGRIAEARGLLLRAWRLRPWDLASLILAMSANRPLLKAYRRVRRWVAGRRIPARSVTTSRGTASR